MRETLGRLPFFIYLCTLKDAILLTLSHSSKLDGTR